MEPQVAAKVDRVGAYLIEVSAQAFRHISKRRRVVIRVIAAVMLALAALWFARATYYVQTDPRIESGQTVVALTPGSTIRPHTYGFSLVLLNVQPQETNHSTNWWARLRPGYDRVAPTQASAAVVRLFGPDDSCRAYNLQLGKPAVYIPGDVKLTFEGMYSGRARFQLERYSVLTQEEVTLGVGEVSDIPGTNYVVSLLPQPRDGATVSDGRDMTYAIYDRDQPDRPLWVRAVVNSVSHFGQVTSQVIRVQPNHVTFRIRHGVGVENEAESCDCNHACPAPLSRLTR